MKLLILILYLSFFSQTFAQDKKPNLSDSCSNILNAVSYFWKNDSLANNGFRLYSYERLLKCKIDSLSISYLVEKLGKPSKIIRSNKGTDYLYYYYDSKKIPKEIPFECLYISFMFDKNGVLTSVYDGVIDY